MKRCDITSKEQDNGNCWDARSLRSGWNVSVAWQTNEVSIMSMPIAGEAMTNYVSLSLPRPVFRTLCEWVLSTARPKWREKTEASNHEGFMIKLDHGWEASTSQGFVDLKNKFVRAPSLLLDRPECRVAVSAEDALRFARWYVEDEIESQKQAA